MFRKYEFFHIRKIKIGNLHTNATLPDEELQSDSEAGNRTIERVIILLRFHEAPALTESMAGSEDFNLISPDASCRERGEAAEDADPVGGTESFESRTAFPCVGLMVGDKVDGDAVFVGVTDRVAGEAVSVSREVTLLAGVFGGEINPSSWTMGWLTERSGPLVRVGGIVGGCWTDGEQNASRCCGVLLDVDQEGKEWNRKEASVVLPKENPLPLQGISTRKFCTKSENNMSGQMNSRYLQKDRTAIEKNPVNIEILTPP